MTPEKQELVGWWRNDKKNNVCVEDRSLGYAFYCIVAVFPFGSSNKMPTLISWIQSMEKESFWKHFTRQFGFVMLLAFSSVMNLPAVQMNNEVVKYMQNWGHFGTALSRTNKRAPMSTERGASMIDLAIKLTFYIDTTRVFSVSDELKKVGKTLVEKLNNEESLEHDEDYVTCISFLLYEKEIWKTAVYLGLDALVVASSMAFYCGKNKLPLDFIGPIRKKGKDKFGNIEFR